MLDPCRNTVSTNKLETITVNSIYLTGQKMAQIGKMSNMHFQSFSLRIISIYDTSMSMIFLKSGYVIFI